MKPLPEHLKYAFLGEGDTLLVIISGKLTKEQEEKLVAVLRRISLQLVGLLPTFEALVPLLACTGFC